jgi:hypothetical protein
MIFTDMQRALMEGGHSIEDYKKPGLMTFVKELHEARFIRDRADLKYSYTEICEFLYLVILSLDFLSRLKEGRLIADRYARLTAGYINYTEFRISATDLYNFIYFVQADPDTVQLLFGNEDSKKLRMKTTIPRMELNRWLMKLSDPQSRDLYFFMRMEQALNISNSDLKDLRRMLAFQSPTASDLRMISAKILNAYRNKLPLLDLRPELEQILSTGKYTYIK